MAQTFEASVDDWVRESQDRLLAVFKTAAQFVFDQIVDQWPRDTGFSAASFTASTSGFAPLIGNQGVMPQVPDYTLAIAGADLGDTIFGSFAANYAVHIEYGSNGRPGRGIVRLAAQNWQQTVNRAVASVKGA